MNNKPKYSFFLNTKYAIDGLRHVLKTESSFKLELVIGFFILIIIFLLDLLLIDKYILVITLVLILIVELLNSAIENVVDLVTIEYKPLAKCAKDIGSTAVFFSIILHVSVWIKAIISIII
ncbi:diacylglycerol kinase [Tenacibaculum sp. nBUS_03]|uniref:diacylglycerol kinase n=1 Tax=Tenacibaculum sp. nBUS_03 TaxID=3395320 RepID=UPI003EBF53CB